MLLFVLALFKLPFALVDGPERLHFHLVWHQLPHQHRVCLLLLAVLGRGGTFLLFHEWANVIPCGESGGFYVVLSGVEIIAVDTSTYHVIDLLLQQLVSLLHDSM